MEKSPPGPLRYDATLDEDGLISASQDDPQAFGMLYNRYLERVYHYLRIRIPVAEDAADLTQQVFMQAFRAISTYRQEGAPFAAWLFRIAHNLVADTARRSKVTVSWQNVPEALQSSAEPGLEEKVVHEEELEELRTLLAQLPPERREILALRFAARLTAREISIIVGKSEAAVQKQLERTLQELRSRASRVERGTGAIVGEGEADLTGVSKRGSYYE